MILEQTKVVLINLKKRTDRLEQFKARQIECGWPLPEPEIFSAIHGDTVGVPGMFMSGGGAWGCRQSHVSILERALMDGVESSLLILEDDIVWRDTIDQQLTSFFAAMPSDWQVAFLGGQHITKAEKVSDGVDRCRNCQRTHAILYCGRDAISATYKQFVMANKHIDHLFGPFSGRMLKAYAPNPFIFGQGEGKSDISGNNDKSRYWSEPKETPLIFLDPDTPKSTIDKLRALGLHTGNWRDGNGRDQGLNKVKGNKTALKKVLDTLAWEVASDQGKVVGVWHPDISLELVRSVWTSPIITATGSVTEIASKAGLL